MAAASSGTVRLFSTFAKGVNLVGNKTLITGQTRLKAIRIYFLRWSDEWLLDYALPPTIATFIRIQRINLVNLIIATGGKGQSRRGGNTFYTGPCKLILTSILTEKI